MKVVSSIAFSRRLIDAHAYQCFYVLIKPKYYISHLHLSHIVFACYSCHLFLYNTRDRNNALTLAWIKFTNATALLCFTSKHVFFEDSIWIIQSPFKVLLTFYEIQCMYITKSKLFWSESALGCT